jgi:hypothetical protein
VDDCHYFRLWQEIFFGIVLAKALGWDVQTETPYKRVSVLGVRAEKNRINVCDSWRDPTVAGSNVKSNFGRSQKRDPL